MPTRSLVSGFVTLTVLVAGRSANAQLTGQLNPAAWFPAPDPAAFGLRSKLALDGYITTDQNLAIAHVALGDGALRLMGGGASRLSSFGAGYSRLLIGRDLGAFGTMTLGGEATLSQSARRGSPVAAFRLTTPLGVRWGSAKGYSVTPFLLPYAELGRTPRFSLAPAGCGVWEPPSCEFVRDGTLRTHAFGLGAGIKFSTPYADVHLALRDLIPARHSWQRWNYQYLDRLALGLSVRFGR